MMVRVAACAMPTLVAWQSTDSVFWELTGHGGSLYFEGTKVSTICRDWSRFSLKDRLCASREATTRSFVTSWRGIGIDGDFPVVGGSFLVSNPDELD